MGILNCYVEFVVFEKATHGEYKYLLLRISTITYGKHFLRYQNYQVKNNTIDEIETCICELALDNSLDVVQS